MRILYVEDHAALRETIGSLMQEAGHVVTACATAEQARELDASQAFDLLLTDVSLPGTSGIDLTRQVLAVNPSRWVVLCTGYELGHYPGTWGPHVRTLLKPFDPDELDELLASIQRSVCTS